MELKNKITIITGGACGIGLAATKLFLKEGAEGIALVDFSQKNLDAAKKFTFYFSDCVEQLEST